MPPVKKLQLDKAAWAWSDSVDPEKISGENVRTAYRLNLPRCKPSSCRRNCRRNPYCLSGLGEARWLGEYQEDTQDEADDPDFEIRQPNSFVGLKNLGATCYVNSLLQLWFHNLSFRRAIFRWNPLEDPLESVMIQSDDGPISSPRTVVGHLQLLFALMQFGKRKYVDPSDFIKVLDLEPSTQQDAQEFSKLFISLLEDSLSQQSNPSVRNLINNNFKGEYSYITRCSKCQKESVSPSLFYELELNVKGNKTLHESLTEFLREEKLEGADMYSCGLCQEKQEAARFIRLQNLPPVLNLQLMRFIYDRQKGHKKKLNSCIQFPDSLDMSIYLDNDCGEKVPLIYNLTAVLIHKGPSAYSGHYVAHICDQITGTWYKFNDEYVEKMEGKKLKLGCEDNLEDGSKKVKQPRLAKGFLASSNAYMLVYTASSVEEGKQPINESDLTSYLLKQVQCSNENFEAVIANAREEKKCRKVSDKVHRAEMASLYNTLHLAETADTMWEAVSTKWLLHWLTNSEQIIEPVDNSKLLCCHNRLDPNSLSDAKYIDMNAAETIYEKYGGGPRLIAAEAQCKECVISKCKEIRIRSKIAEDAKEILNLLKQKENHDGPGFWVGKTSLKTWRKKATQHFTEKEEEIIKPINSDQVSSTFISKQDSGELLHSTDNEESPPVSECIKNLDNPNVCPRDVETKSVSEGTNNSINSDDVIVPHQKKCKVSDNSITETLEQILKLASSALSFYSLNENNCSEVTHNINDLNLLRSQWENVGEKLKEFCDKNIGPGAVATENMECSDFSENCVENMEGECHSVLNGTVCNTADSTTGRKRKLEEEEEKDGDSCEEGRTNGTGHMRSDDEDEVYEAFNEDIICTHGNMVHEESARRLVPENVWNILKGYFPDAREFSKDTEPCRQCQCLASEGQVAKDMYKQQAHVQKEMLQGLLLSRNRPKPKMLGSYHIVSVSEFLDPWKKFIREAGRREPLYSLRNATLLCPHGSLLYNPDLDEDSSKLALVTDQEWKVLSQLYLVDQEITVTWSENNEPTTTPSICWECVMARLEDEQKALLQYTKAKLYIRQVATTKTSDENSDTNAAPNSPPEANSTTPTAPKKPSTPKGETEAVRRSTRHRRVRGEKEITISSTQTLKDLKLQILQCCKVPPYDQHLMTEDGRELLDNTATLASLNIYPNSVIMLKVDEPPEDTATPVEDFIRTPEPEAGFKGTGLMKRL